MLAVRPNLFCINLLFLACTSQNAGSVQQIANTSKPQSENGKSTATEKKLSGLEKLPSQTKNPVPNASNTYVFQIIAVTGDVKTFVVKDVHSDSVVYKGDTNLSITWEDEWHISIGQPKGMIKADEQQTANGYLINIKTGKKIWRN
ncbi:MAG: hypothetical protein KDD94_11095 [Calditrichaeota bacterium]|nr:hypothetical protein [Calditrichota bacterium]